MAATSPPSVRDRLLPGLRAGLLTPSRGNLIAGLTVTAYLVPQVMAYATVAGLPAIVGLWASLPALLIYPLLGTSRLLSLGPESSLALMTAALVGPLALGDPSRYAAYAAALAIIVGVLGLLASLLRLGFIADLLSKPVLVGYMAGIGVLMIDGQIDNLLGVSTAADGLLPHLAEVVAAVSSGRFDAAVLLLGLGVLAGLFLLDRVRPNWPGPLLVLIAAAAAASAAISRGAVIPLVGPVPQGLPHPGLPAVTPGEGATLLVGAAGILLVGFTDVVLTGRAFLRRDDHRPDTNAELRAVSLGNLGSGLLQGMPVSSSGSRTALARTTGARSQGYSLVVTAGVVIVLLIAGPALSVTPRTGLAALVIFAAIGLIDAAAFRSLWRFDRVEFGLALVTMLGVLFVGLLFGVVVAVGLSVLAMAAKVARPHSAALGYVPGVAGMHDVDDFEDVVEVPGLLIFRYDSPLFFANSQDFADRAQDFIAQRQPGLRWFAINCEAIVDIDATAAETLAGLIRELEDDGLEFCLVRAKRELVERLDGAGVAELIGRDRMYPTLPSLVEAFRSELR